MGTTKHAQVGASAVEHALAVAVFVVFGGYILFGCPPGPVAPPLDGGDSSVEAAPTPPPPLPPPAPEAGAEAGVSLVEAACANLAKLGCKAGTGNCVAVLGHVVDSGLADLKPGCLASAKTLADVAACGTVSCK